MPSPVRRLAVIAFIAALVAACSPSGTGGSPVGATDAGGSASSGGQPVTLRLGYFPNLTHATAIAGIREGIFADALGPDVTLETKPFNAGPEAVEAIFSGALDASFIGPNPAINAYAKSNGEAIRIVSGATSGGAYLVVRPDISSAEDLRGKKLATPQLGNTQDVALRAWLKEQGLTTDVQGGGDVSILPQPNAQTLETFRSGEIDGAWVPEPWATRLIQEGGGKVLVDERELWPDGQYVTTHLVVTPAFLDAHPGIVKDLLAGVVEATDFVNADAATAQAVVNEGIKAVTDKPLAEPVIAAAWPNLTFTVDPITASLETSATEATELELLDPTDLTGIYDLSLLNEVLREAGRPEIPQP
ncbi:MAG TPA: ABC transporter substrate-binding protein [Candidatus Limnocylindrales bacterium]